MNVACSAQTLETTGPRARRDHRLCRSHLQSRAGCNYSTRQWPSTVSRTTLAVTQPTTAVAFPSLGLPEPLRNPKAPAAAASPLPSRRRRLYMLLFARRHYLNWRPFPPVSGGPTAVHRNTPRQRRPHFYLRRRAQWIPGQPRGPTTPAGKFLGRDIGPGTNRPL